MNETIALADPDHHCHQHAKRCIRRARAAVLPSSQATKTEPHAPRV